MVQTNHKIKNIFYFKFQDLGVNADIAFTPSITIYEVQTQYFEKQHRKQHNSLLCLFERQHRKQEIGIYPELEDTRFRMNSAGGNGLAEVGCLEVSP